jgi:hypothetical protein
MNYSEIVLAIIIVIAALGVSLRLLRRRGHDSIAKNDVEESGPRELRRGELSKNRERRPPSRWIYFFMVLLAFIALNAAFKQLNFLGDELAYIEAQLVTFEMQRATMLPLWAIELILLFVWIPGQWLQPVLINGAETIWYRHRWHRNGTTHFILWNGVDLEVLDRFLEHHGMRYQAVGILNRDYMPGKWKIEALETPCKEIREIVNAEDDVRYYAERFDRIYDETMSLPITADEKLIHLASAMRGNNEEKK